MMIGSLAMMLIALPADDADDPLVLEADQPMGFDDDRFIHGWCWWSNLDENKIISLSRVLMITLGLEANYLNSI